MRIRILTKILATFVAALTVTVVSKFAIDLTLKPKEYTVADDDDIDKHGLSSDGSLEGTDKFPKSSNDPGLPSPPLLKPEPGFNNGGSATVDSSDKSFQIRPYEFISVDKWNIINPKLLNCLYIRPFEFIPDMRLIIDSNGLIVAPYSYYRSLKRPNASQSLLNLDKILNKHAKYCGKYCLRFGMIFCNIICIEDHSYRQDDIYRYLFSRKEILDLANELREFANDDRTKKEVAKVIATMSDRCPGCGKSLSSFSHEDFLSLADLLEHCANSKEAQPFVLNAVFKMVENYSHSVEEFDRLAKILTECANNQIFGPHVADAVSKMIEKDLLRGYTYAERLNLIDVLKSCADSEQARPYVAKAIGDMAEKDLLRGYTYAERLNLIDVLKSCADSEKARLYVAYVINQIAEKSVSNYEEISKLADILWECADSERACPYIVNAVSKMFENYLCVDYDNYLNGEYDLNFGGLEKIFLKFTDILEKCANSEKVRPYVAKAIDDMAEKDLLERYTHEELLNLTNVLKSCADSERARSYVANAVSKMAEKDLLRGYTHAQFLNLTDVLKSCADSEKARPYVANAVSKMAEKDLLRGYTHEELLNLTNVLKSCADSEKARPHVANAVSKMAEKDLLRGYTHEELLNLTNVLKSCADSEKARPHVAKAIGDMAEKDLLRGYTHAQFLNLTDVLKSCADSEKARPHVANAVSKMAEKDLLRGYTYAELLNITDVLKSCADSEFARLGVAKAVSKMVEKDLLRGYTHAQFLNLTNVLKSCADSEFARLGVAEAISKMVEKDLLEELSNNADISIVDKTLVRYSNEGFLNLTNVLKSCANSGFARPCVANVVNKMVGKNLIQEYAHGEILNLIDALKSCAGEGFAQPYVAKSVEKLARKGLLTGYLSKRPDPPPVMSVDPVFHFSHNPLWQYDCEMYYPRREYINREYNHRYFVPCANMMVVGGPPSRSSMDFEHAYILSDDINIHEQGVSFAVDFENNQPASPPAFEEDIRFEDNRFEDIRLEDIEPEEIRIEDNWYEIINVPENNEIIEENEIDEIREDLGFEIDPNIINDFLDEYSQEKLLELTDALRKCANSQKARPFVAKAIYEMAEKGLFKEYFNFQIRQITDALRECADADGAKSDVAKAIYEMASEDLLKECTHEELLDITNVLKSCAKESSARLKVSEAIADLARKGLLDELSIDEILTVKDTLLKCAETQSALLSVKETISALSDKLVSCAKKPSARLKVSEAIADLARKDFLNGLSNDKVLKMVDALKLCVSDNRARPYVAISIFRLASNNLLGVLENQPIKLVEMLDECLANYDGVTEVRKSIEVLLGENNMQKYYDQTTDEGRKRVLEELVGESLLKNLTADGKEKLKNIIYRCISDTIFKI